MQHDEEDAGVWPAYVAAVAGLVQSLLFVSAIMALTLLQVGMLAGRKVDETLAQSLAQPVPKPVARAAGTRPTPEGRLSVRFAPEALRFDDAAREKLRNELRRQKAAGMRSWVVQIETDVDDPLARRAAYLRLMAARAVFIDVEIDMARVTLRLLPRAVGTDASQSGQVLLVQPSRDDVSAARPAGER